jgi:Tol biopolymer transport system component
MYSQRSLKMGKRTTIALALAAGFIIIASRLFTGAAPGIQETDQQPKIDPDYTGLIIPPNIAPLNFRVLEPGGRFQALIEPVNGPSFRLKSRDGAFYFSRRQWEKMLRRNRGQSYSVTVQVRKSDQWVRYAAFRNTVSEDPIDGYLVYRMLDPSFVNTRAMGIYQRELTTFKETTLLHSSFLPACYNCHAFYQKKPDKMMLHIRGDLAGGTFIIDHGKITKINTKTLINKAPGAYRSWHPSGKLIAFSVNIVRQFFHATGYTQEGYDKVSDLILYNLEKNTVTSSLHIANPYYLETYPEWSPDGKTLYFCRAKQPDFNSNFEEEYNRIMYDLMRIPYDLQNGTLGTPEVVLDHKKTGFSVAQPRISPDGRFLLFAAGKYGTFMIHRPGGDITLLNMKTGALFQPDINSDRPESYNTWSSNSRWFIFSSKKRNDVCTHPYICHIDTAGHVSKAFIVPQKNPAFYDTHIMSYNVPELVQGPIQVSGRDIAAVALNKSLEVQAEVDSDAPVDALTQATVKSEYLESFQ